MRVRLSFATSFLLDNCWFGFESDIVLTVNDLCKVIQQRFKLDCIILEMDGFVLLGEDEIATVLRDDDLLVVLEAPISNEETPQKRSLEVKIQDRDSDTSQDTVSNENPDISSTNQLNLVKTTKSSSTTENDTTSVSKDHILQIVEKIPITDAQIHSTVLSLENGEVSATNTIGTIQEENNEDKDLFIPIPDFSEDELDDSFKTTTDDLTVIS